MLSRHPRILEDDVVIQAATDRYDGPRQVNCAPAIEDQEWPRECVSWRLQATSQFLARQLTGPFDRGRVRWWAPCLYQYLARAETRARKDGYGGRGRQRQAGLGRKLRDVGSQVVL
jgi:hypothetical protein